MNNKIWLKRIIGSVFGLFVFAAVMLVLTHTAQNSVAATQILPTINPDPVYVECPAGEEREITWKVKEDFPSVALIFFWLMFLRKVRESFV